MRRYIGVSLIGLGAFLVAAGLLTRFYAAPALIGAPPDLYQVTRLRAENATYLDASSFTVRTGATVVATNTVRGDAKASGDGTVVWDSGTIIQDAGSGDTIEIQNARYPFDHRTAVLKNCCRAAVQGDRGVRMSGVGLFWPVEARKRDVQVFDPVTARAWPAAFDGEDRTDGLRTYRYVQRVPETAVPGDLPPLPASLFGRPEDDPPVEATRHYRVDATYWIDPRTGAVVDQRRHVVSTLRPAQGPESAVVADFDLRMTPESRRSLRERSDDGAGTIRLLTAVVPLAASGAGLAAAAVGLVLVVPGARPRRRGARHAGEPQDR